MKTDRPSLLTGSTSMLVPAWQNPYWPWPADLGFASHGSQYSSWSRAFVIEIQRPRPHKYDAPNFRNRWAHA